MVISTTNVANQGLTLINLQTSYVNVAGTTVTLSPTTWMLQVIDSCITAFFLPKSFLNEVLISGQTDAIKIPEFQINLGTLCGPQLF